MKPPISIQSIRQKDNHTFTVDWNDGVSQDYTLSALQRECSCPFCINKIELNVSDDVRAVVIKNVGCYGLRIQFTSGCSNGIYTFEKLRQMSV